MVANDAFLVGNRAPQARRRMRLFLVAGVFLAAVCVSYLVFLRLTRIAPPPIPASVRAAAELPVVVHGPRAYVGPNWMSREHGVWELHLEREPYAMGFAQARLGSRLLLE